MHSFVDENILTCIIMQVPHDHGFPMGIDRFPLYRDRALSSRDIPIPYRYPSRVTLLTSVPGRPGHACIRVRRCTGVNDIDVNFQVNSLYF